MKRIHIDKEELIQLVEKGLSTRQIAKELNCSQTNVRYWLRKNGLNTKSITNPSCLFCGKQLTGQQSKYCSRDCKQKAYNCSSNYSYQKNKGMQRKKELVRLKGGKCSMCGYSKNYAALQFHHRDPNNKTFPLDIRKCSNTRMSSLLIEVQKCDLLCANCHLELHHPSLST